MSLAQCIADAIHDHLMANLPPNKKEFKAIVQAQLMQNLAVAKAIASLAWHADNHAVPAIAERTREIKDMLVRERTGSVSP